MENQKLEFDGATIARSKGLLLTLPHDTTHLNVIEVPL
jgi:hypothetical protein